jgi:hypothetical protein
METVMTRSPPIRLFILLLPLLALGQKADDSSADKSMVLTLEGAWNQAELHHDANAAAALLADTFISVDHHGILLNKSQYLVDLKDLSFNPEEISNTDTSVYLYGAVAIVTSASRTQGLDSGFAHHGRFGDTWIKWNGKWQCVADQETLIN